MEPCEAKSKAIFVRAKSIIRGMAKFLAHANLLAVCKFITILATISLVRD